MDLRVGLPMFFLVGLGVGLELGVGAGSSMFWATCLVFKDDFLGWV